MTAISSSLTERIFNLLEDTEYDIENEREKLVERRFKEAAACSDPDLRVGMLRKIISDFGLDRT